MTKNKKGHFSPGRLFYVKPTWINVQSPLSTMAPSAAADQSCATPQVHTASSNPPLSLATKKLVTQDYDLVLCAIFPTPAVPAKFNPIIAMKNLF